MSERELPAGWAWATVGELAEANLGKMLDKAKNTAGQRLPYLRNQNVRWECFDLSDTSEMFFKDDELARFGLKPGDVLICEGGEPGRAAIWRESESSIKFQKALHRVRPYGALVPEWLIAHLKLDAASGALGDHFTGTTIKHFTGQALARYPVALPPLNEQKRIVAKLEAVQARAEGAKAALDAVGGLLEKFRQSVLAAAFRGDLTREWRAQNPNTEPASALLARIRAERRQRWAAANPKKKYVEPEPVDATNLPELPGGWCWARVDEVGEADLGRQRAPSNHNGPHMRPYLRVANVFENRIDFGDVMEMNFEPHEYEHFKLESGDVLLNEGQSKELLGRPAIYRGEMPGVCFTNTLLRYRPSGGIAPEYALCVFRGYMRTGRFQQIGKITTNIAHLGANRFRELEFPVAPLAEQVEVVRLVESYFAFADQLSKVASDNLVAVGRLNQATLAKAFRGELVPQNPADEPASALLARIAATRSTEAPKRRGRRPKV